MADTQDTPPSIETERDVRFAVVMYGGVSLAIYINGVAQELLELVRATARDPAQLGPTGLVYRRMAQLRLVAGEVAHEESPATEPIHTRFSIDVISGTSAGGINGVFLAKALAHDQSLNTIRELWFQEADIARLINDRDANVGLASPLPRKPTASLLSGDRMFLKLVEALKGMDEEAKPNRAALVPEIDLFVTKTDVRGAILPIQLADGPVYERRYKSACRFRRSTELGVDHFDSRFTDFLAFASRCTSSFPVAFAPMHLADVPDLLDTDDAREFLNKPDWQAFMEDYVGEGANAEKIAESFAGRSFTDGGYLDNKPFGHAIDVLGEKESEFRVSRKLIYIEPAPETLPVDSEHKPQPPPNAIENAVDALISLPGYETIREDLQRVVDRNRLIESVDRLTANLAADARNAGQIPVDIGSDFASKGLNYMIARRGVAYGGYHRLKIKAITDEIATIFARRLGFDADSDHFLAIRYLVKGWRDQNYLTDPKDGATKSQNAFLMDFDASYRSRRILEVMRKADALGLWDDTARALATEILGSGEVGNLDARNVRAAVRGAKQALGRAQAIVRRAQAKLHKRWPDAEWQRQYKLAEVSAELLAILEKTTDDARNECAEALLAKIRTPFEAAITEVAKELGGAFISASKLIMDRLRASHPKTAEDGAVNQLLHHAYRRFDDIDMITFPIFYSTNVGEPSTVDVFRVSPRDAKSLFVETEQNPKLAGNVLAHFGAFLDIAWRRNDLMWGRLDAAERIVDIVLTKQHPLRLRFIEDLQAAILHMELVGENKERFEAFAKRAQPDGTRSRYAPFFSGGQYALDRSLDPARLLPEAERAARVLERIFANIENGYERSRNTVGALLSRLGKHLLRAGVRLLRVFAAGYSIAGAVRHILSRGPSLILGSVTFVVLATLGCGWLGQARSFLNGAPTEHFIAVGCVALLALAVSMQVIGIGGGGFPLTLGVQFARSNDALSRLFLGETGRERAARLALATRIDNLFALAYMVTLDLMAIWLMRQGAAIALELGACLFVHVTGACDLMENGAMIRALGTIAGGKELSGTAAADIRSPSLLKWTSLYPALAFLAFGAAQVGGRVPDLFAAAFGLAALCGVFAIFSVRAIAIGYLFISAAVIIALLYFGNVFG